MLGIHLGQAGSPGVDWDSFLRNITFCEVSAQKDRQHCWIYFPNHFCLWDWCKPCSLINLPLRPFSLHLPLDLITFVFSSQNLFFLFFFFLSTITCQLAEHFLSVMLQDRRPAQGERPGLSNHTPVTALLFPHLPPLSHALPKFQT